MGVYVPQGVSADPHQGSKINGILQQISKVGEAVESIADDKKEDDNAEIPLENV